MILIVQEPTFASCKHYVHTNFFILFNYLRTKTRHKKSVFIIINNLMNRIEFAVYNHTVLVDCICLFYDVYIICTCFKWKINPLYEANYESVYFVINLYCAQEMYIDIF